MALISNIVMSALFGLAYFTCFVMQVEVLSDFDFLPTASILFVPAGVKFLALLILRWWGVFGIALGRAFVHLYTGQEIFAAHEIIELFLWVVLPYLCMIAYMEKQKLNLSLVDLTTFHLVALCMILSVTSSLGTQVWDYWSGYKFTISIPKATWAMTVGDFSGMLLTMFAIILVQRFRLKSATNSD